MGYKVVRGYGRTNWLGGVVLALTGVCWMQASPAGAAGYALKEQSGRLLGSAFAGATAEAADPSYSFFNPAGLVRHDGSQAVVVGTVIRPRFDPDDAEAETIGGASVPGGGGGTDAAPDVVLPAAYATQELSPDLKLGLAINVPFGLETNYPADWAGRYHALNSHLRSINLNPMMAYEVTDWLALGGGPQAQYTEARLTNAIDFGTIGDLRGLPGAQPAGQDGNVELEGGDWGFGYNLGALITPFDGTRIGIGYRSRVRHDLDAEADFSLDRAGVGQALRAQSGAFRDTSASAALTTPATASFGVHQTLGSGWAVMGELQLTTWSDFETLRVTFDNAAQPDSVTEENWQDSWFAAAGVVYTPSATWEFRGGIAYDQSPIPHNTKTPRVPGGDRTWLALGASYAPLPGVSIQAGYTHIFVADATVRLDAAQPGNRQRGDLSVDYSNGIDLLSIQVSLAF